MKLIMALTMCLAMFTAKAQSDTTNQQPESQGQQDQAKKVSCAIIDRNTLACFSDAVDVNHDKKIEADEWNNADVADKGIIELDNLYDENEVFESDGIYKYDDLFDYSYNDSAKGNDSYNRNDVDLFDDDEDGAFE